MFIVRSKLDEIKITFSGFSPIYVELWASMMITWRFTVPGTSLIDNNSLGPHVWSYEAGTISFPFCRCRNRPREAK